MKNVLNRIIFVTFAIFSLLFFFRMDIQAEEVGNKASNPVNIVFDKTYVKTWNKDTDHLNHYNKFELTEQGIVTITATKPEDSDEYGRLIFVLYDEDMNPIWSNGTRNAKSDPSESYKLYIGLGEGIYYLTIKPGFYVTSGVIETYYSLSFNSNQFCEIEPNASLTIATPMKLNNMYKGFYGEDSSDYEEADYWKVYLFKGNSYRFKISDFSSLANTTIQFDMIDFSGNSVSEVRKIKLGKTIDENNYNYVDFKATTTGWHSIKVNSYHDRQISYTMGVYENEADIPISGLSLNKSDLDIEIGKSEKLIATITPDNATDKSIEWTSDNTSIATVDSEGNVYGVSEGYTRVYAKAGKYSESCYVNVNAKVIAVDSVSLDKTEIELSVGESIRLNETVSPSNATDRNVSWSSSDTSVATVNSWGDVEGVSKGTAKIAVKAGNKTAICTVKVKSQVTGLALDNKELTLFIGEKGKLVATVTPSSATDVSVEWSSDNTSIVSVDNEGNIKALSEGYAHIYAKAGNKEERCYVKVKKDPNPDYIAGKDCSWNEVDGKYYWYENGYKQGTYDDPKGVIGDGTVRGREICDNNIKDLNGNGTWFWLDAVYGGAKAEGKEVWMPYIYQDEAKWSSEEIERLSAESDYGMDGMGKCVRDAIVKKAGKWVRYDNEGKMCKGWITIEGSLASKYPDQKGNKYYYDTRTGLMAKGWVKIDGVDYYFDEVTGVLR